MPTICARAPEFTLPDEDGQPTSLSNLLRIGPLILHFYPADFTPGCTREACQMRDLHSEVDAARLRVAGVSPQGPESHRAFRDKYKPPFTLLADVDRFVIKMYGVQGPLGFGVRRTTFRSTRHGMSRTLSSPTFASASTRRSCAGQSHSARIRA